jgi:3-oxoadipate enol-lactonase
MMGDRAAVGLHYTEDGRAGGPPLVLLGSLGSTLDMWRPQLAALGERWRLIRVDHRGHGDSPVPPGPYMVAELAGDVLALLDKLALDRVSVVGLSLGGTIGMYLASEATERLDRLVLCATSAGWPDPSTWDERIEAVKRGGTASIAEATVSRWLTPDYAAEHPDTVAWMRGMVTHTPDVGYLGCCHALREWNHVDRLGVITAPTLLICGIEDPSTPEDPHAAVIATGIPGVRFERVHAAHLLNVERADEVNKLLTAFLNS